MLDRANFLRIVATEALTNPRTAPYQVALLHRDEPRVYPFRADDGAMPAVVLQFTVERQDGPGVIGRVITVARTQEGYSVWCGDRFTEGRLREALDIDVLIREAVLPLPTRAMSRAAEDMYGLEGAYQRYAPCHFWKAWHSHQGLCKHVAAALQSVDAYFAGGVEGVLDTLDLAFSRLVGGWQDSDLLEPGFTTAVGPSLQELTLAAQAKLRLRGEVLAMVSEVTQPIGGLTPTQFSRLQELLEQLGR